MGTSVLNSTITPLVASTEYTGSAEVVKNYTTISVMIKTDQSCTLLIDHGDGSNWDHTDTFSVLAGTSLFKQVSVKGSYFRCRVSNGVFAQTYLRLYTKLLQHAIPDDINVKLDTTDSIVSVLKDAGGNAVSVVSNKLSVSQTALAHGTDNVLCYGWDGATNRKLLTNTQGAIETTHVPLSNATDNLLAYGWDGTTNQKLKTNNAGKLDVVTSLADETSFVSSSLQSTPIEVKSSSGNLKGVQLFNDSVQSRNVRFYDKLLAPVAADTPKLYFELAPNSNLVVPSINVLFATKIWVAASATRGVTGSLNNVNADEISVCAQLI